MRIRSQLMEELNEMQFNGQYQMIANEKSHKVKYISFAVLFLALAGNIIYAVTKINSQSLANPDVGESSLDSVVKANKTVVNHITVRQLQNAILLKKSFLSSSLDISSLEDQKSFEKYKLNEFKELPLCVFSIVEKKKNIELFIKSLSVQRYSNFRVLLIDQTGEKQFSQQVHKIIKRFSGLEGKITIKSTSKHEGFLNNSFYAAKEFCKSNEILIEYSQKSMILGTFVFKLFNKIFHESQVWLAYGSALLNNNKVAEYGEYHRDIIDSSTFRKQPYLLGNVIAYAPDLVNYIQEEDLKDLKSKRGFYFTLLELAKRKIRFIPQILEAEMKDVKSENEHNEKQQKLIREKNPVKAIGSLKHLPSY